jgi:hypothetical protein
LAETLAGWLARPLGVKDNPSMTRRSPLVLRPQGFHWLAEQGKEAIDQCAHADVIFAVDDIVVVSPEDGAFNVSATGLYLLRTLSESHTRARPVAEDNQLFACCGHVVVTSPGHFPVVVVGCDAGIDPEIERSGGTVIVHTPGGRRVSVSADAWRLAVLGFCETVEAFYEASAPKTPADAFDAEGWRAFWVEWRERASAAI